MLKLAKLLFIFLILITILQGCTYIGLHDKQFEIAIIGPDGNPEDAMVNSDAFSYNLEPSEDKYLHVNIGYKMPIFSVNGKNSFFKIDNTTQTSTPLYLLDSKKIHIFHRFYINDGLSLNGTLPATDNLYYMDYFGKGRLENGILDLTIPNSIYTIYFPQYDKTFLIKDGQFSQMSQYNWSVKLYMDDGGNLKDALLSDLNEIKNNYFTPQNSSITAYARFVGEGHKVYKYLRAQRFTVFSTLTDESYNWKNLRNFIKIETDSKYKALFLWDHGDSWVYRNKAMFQDSLNFMNLTDLSSALTGYHFDLIAFDMCLMGSVETLYQIKNFADYVLFSKNLVPNYGFDYENLLCGDRSPRDFAKYISDRYENFYLNEEHSKKYLTAVDVSYSNSNDFFKDLNNLSILLTAFASPNQNFIEYLKNSMDSIEYSNLNNYGYQISLIDFLNVVSKYGSLTEKIGNQISKSEEVLSKMNFLNYKDIGIAFVEKNGYFNFDNYEHCDFARKIKWIDFLRLLSDRF